MPRTKGATSTVPVLRRDLVKYFGPSAVIWMERNQAIRSGIPILAEKEWKIKYDKKEKNGAAMKVVKDQRKAATSTEESQPLKEEKIVSDIY